MRMQQRRYVENGEWILSGVTSKRSVLEYDCCDGKFPDVTYRLELRRRTLFYMMNFILPCVLIAVLTLLVFLLPPESGERMSFGVTVLLSFTILLLMLMVSLVLFCFFFACDSPASYPSPKNYEPISVKQGLVQCLSNRLGHFVFHEGNLHFKLIPLPYWKVLGVRISQIPFSYLYILH